MAKEEELTIELPYTQEQRVTTHQHTGTDNPKISLKDISGLIEVVDTIPTSSPKSVYNQIKMYIKSPESSLCIYDYNSKTWKFSGLS